jgi:hypothetical protein
MAAMAFALAELLIDDFELARERVESLELSHELTLLTESSGLISAFACGECAAIVISRNICKSFPFSIKVANCSVVARVDNYAALNWQEIAFRSSQ